MWCWAGCASSGRRDGRTRWADDGALGVLDHRVFVRAVGGSGVPHRASACNRTSCCEHKMCSEYGKAPKIKVRTQDMQIGGDTLPPSLLALTSPAPLFYRFRYLLATEVRERRRRLLQIGGHNVSSRCVSHLVMLCVSFHATPIFSRFNQLISPASRSNSFFRTIHATGARKLFPGDTESNAIICVSVHIMCTDVSY